MFLNAKTYWMYPPGDRVEIRWLGWCGGAVTE